MGQPPREPPIVGPPIRLAVCVSGGGSTLQNLIDRTGDGRLRAEIVRVVASRGGIGAIERAERAGIATTVVDRRMRQMAGGGAAVFGPIREGGADLVVLAGFLALLEIPREYRGRVINVHPALIPAFSGRGFHGLAVHRAALECGVKVSGCTVHLADDTYDTGPILLQRTVEVRDDDTAEALAARVQAAECEALPAAIAMYAAGRFRVEGRRVRTVDAAD